MFHTSYNYIDQSVSFSDNEGFSCMGQLKIGLAGFTGSKGTGRDVSLKITQKDIIPFELINKRHVSTHDHTLFRLYMDLEKKGLTDVHGTVDMLKGKVDNKAVDAMGFYIGEYYVYSVYIDKKTFFLMGDKSGNSYNLIRNPVYLMNLYKRYPELIPPKGGI